MKKKNDKLQLIIFLQKNNELDIMERICCGEVSCMDGFICTEDDLKKLVDNAITIALQKYDRETTSTPNEVII